MKIFVKSLKGNHFQIEVEPQHTVSDVKKNIESVQGANVFPASQQILIYQGKALTDGTTLEENKVAENSFIVVMLCKSKNSSRENSVAATAMPTSNIKISYGESSVAAVAMPTSKNTGESSVTAAAMPTSKGKSLSRESPAAETAMPTSKNKSFSGESPVAAAAMPMPMSKDNSSSGKSSVAADAVCTSKAPATTESLSAEASTTLTSYVSNEASTTLPSNVSDASVPANMPTSVPVPVNASSVSGTDVGCQVASNPVAGDGLENIIQHILDMGGGIWDRDTVVNALRAASNDPERAVEFLYTGVPKPAEDGQQPTKASAVSQLPTTPTTVPASRHNAGPLNIFPQGLPNMGTDSGPLDFLRHSEQFQALRSMVQANPQTLQPLLQELGKQNPNLMKLIQEHQTDFQRLLNEPVQGQEGNILEQFAGAVPQAIQVTPEEHTSLERLEAMGFDRSTVLEAYFACNKNEELAANYLLDHMHDF